ncbi:MAG: hypothetical protein OXE87_15665 [Chloroflexi bacterium]|nr:hypothetical protein [Chloroflexota bacterium]
MNLEEYLDHDELFVLVLLWIMPLGSAHELESVARTWGVRNLRDRLRAAQRNGSVTHISGGFLARRVRRYALTRYGVEQVCRNCGTQPVWQVTEAGLLRLLECLDMVETVYALVATLFRIDIRECSDQADEILINAMAWPSEGWEGSRLTGFRWLRDGRVAGYALYEGGLQVPMCRVGVLDRDEALDASVKGVYRDMNNQGEAKHMERVAARLATTVLVVDDAIGYCSIKRKGPMDTRYIVADRKGKRFRIMRSCHQFSRFLPPAEEEVLGLPETMVEWWKNHPLGQQRTGPQAVLVLEALTKLLVVNLDSLMKWCGGSDGTYLRRALQSWIGYGLVEMRGSWCVFTNAGIGLISRRYWLPEEEVREYFRSRGVGLGQPDMRTLDRAGAVSRVLTAICTQVQGSVIALPGSYRGDYAMQNAPGFGIPDAWLLDRDASYRPNPLIYVDADDDRSIHEVLLPWLREAQALGEQPLGVVAKTRRIEQRCWRNPGRLRMYTTTESELLKGEPAGSPTIWRRPPEETSDDWWEEVVHPGLVGRLSSNPFGLVR